MVHKNFFKKRWLSAFVIGAAIIVFGVDEESPNAADGTTSDSAVEIKTSVDLSS